MNFIFWCSSCDFWTQIELFKSEHHINKTGVQVVCCSLSLSLQPNPTLVLLLLYSSVPHDAIQQDSSSSSMGLGWRDTVWQTPWTSLDVLDSMLSVCLFSDALWSSLSGVCLGMQVAVIEFARNVLGWGSKSYTRAHSLSHSHSLWVNLFDGMGYLCGGTFFWKHRHWYTPTNRHTSTIVHSLTIVLFYKNLLTKLWIVFTCSCLFLIRCQLDWIRCRHWTTSGELV